LSRARGGYVGHGEISDKPGAEAPSGLARAFFYAGAKSLVVSHWEVDSEATVVLMDGLFEALRANPRLSHAEALRMSMLRISQERPASAARVIGKANWNSDPFLPSDDAVS